MCDLFGSDIMDEIDAEERSKPTPTVVAAESHSKPPKKEKFANEKKDAERFEAKKKHILQNLQSMCATDRSPKGSVDGRCFPIMKLLNEHPDYVTTSSCSGRVALFHQGPATCDSGSQEPNDENEVQSSAEHNMKRAGGAGWLFVSHECATPTEETEIVEVVVGAAKNPLLGSGHCSLKSEPFVMHVQCRTLEAAKALHHVAATTAGFRNSGLTIGKLWTTVAIRHAHSFDCPVIIEGRNCGDAAYLRSLVQICNKRLKDNFLQMDRLEHAIRQLLTSSRGME